MNEWEWPVVFHLELNIDDYIFNLNVTTQNIIFWCSLNESCGVNGF